MNKVEYKNISIDKIVEPEWDIRKDTKDSDDDSNLNGLVQSIKKDGVINPITVSKTETDKYVIVAGRRRFKACKILRLKEIPVRLQSEPYDESDKQRIALIENLHRKDLSDTEKAEGILAVYTSSEYQSEDVVRLIKYFENNGYQPGKTDRSLILGNASLKKSNIKSKTELMINEKFLDIVDSIGYSPNTQYKYLQIAVKLDPSVLKEAEDKGLSINKKIMLTNTTLREFPELQKFLIDRIANQSEHVARTIISETTRQIENDDKISKEKLLETVEKIQNQKQRIKELERKIKEIEQSEDPWHITMSEDLEEILSSLETKEFLKKANTNKKYLDLKNSLLKQKTERGYPLPLVKTYVSSNNELVKIYEGLVLAKDIIYPIIFTWNLTKKYNSSFVFDKIKKEKMEQQFNLR